MLKKINEIAKSIQEAEKIVLFHHKKPDGDTISSSYGLLLALKLKYPNKTIKWVADQKFLKNNFSFLDFDFKNTIANESEVDETWLGIIGDTSIDERIFGFDTFNKTGFKICFDHHIDPTNLKLDIYWQENTLGASALQAFYIVQELDIKLTESVALFILFGILTDTGFFQYSLNDTRVLSAASKLFESISKDSLSELYRKMKQRNKKDLELVGHAYSNHTLKNGVIYCLWTTDIMKRLDTNEAEISKHVNCLSNIDNARIWMFIIERDEDYKISMRSSGPNVNKIASIFGGGGHIRASGASIEPKSMDLVNCLIQEAEKTVINFNDSESKAYDVGQIIKPENTKYFVFESQNNNDYKSLDWAIFAKPGYDWNQRQGFYRNIKNKKHKLIKTFMQAQDDSMFCSLNMPANEHENLKKLYYWIVKNKKN